MCRVLYSSDFAYYTLILTTLTAVLLIVTKFSFLYRPFALRRESRCHEHLAWVMSLPPSQFFFVILLSAIFLRYWQITSALKKSNKSHCSEVRQFTFKYFWRGGRGRASSSSCCSWDKEEGLDRRYLHYTVTECLSLLLCGCCCFILYVPRSLLY